MQVVNIFSALVALVASPPVRGVLSLLAADLAAHVDRLAVVEEPRQLVALAVALVALTVPFRLLFRRLLPPTTLRAVDALLDGYRSAPDHAALEAILNRAEALLLGGHHLHLTHHRVKRRSLHPLIRDVHPDAYGRIDFKRLWLPPAEG